MRRFEHLTNKELILLRDVLRAFGFSLSRLLPYEDGSISLDVVERVVLLGDEVIQELEGRSNESN